MKNVSKHDMRQIKYYVLSCSNCILSVLHKDSKHLSRQIMKFVYLLLTSSLNVLNMVYKHDAATADIRVLSFNLQSMCSKYRPETCLASSALALNIQPICAENVSKQVRLQVM
jgi:hypothetical protein